MGGEVRRATLMTLGEPAHLTALGLFWTQATALAVWWISSQRWALAWLGVDAILFALRLLANRRLASEYRRERHLPTRLFFVTHATWFATIAAGTFLTVSQSDVRLLLLGTLLPVGYCGYVVSRWQAFPGFASCFIHGLWAALFAGLLVSPMPGMRDVAWLIPAGGLAFAALLDLNHRIIMTALLAQQENRRLSMHDPLTELPNRLMLREILTRLCRGLDPASPHAGFAVMCLDLDGFKEVNDRHGHAAGDWLLKSVAARLCAEVRADDVVCRVGGDEFVILLPDIGEDAAVAIARRCLEAVTRHHDLGDLSSVRGGLSVGIALAPAHGQQPDALLAAADTALYAAKRAGKGRWAVHADPSSAADRA